MGFRRDSASDDYAGEDKDEDQGDYSDCLPGDRGCLQWVLGVPLGLVYLPAAYLCLLLLRADPAPDDVRLRDDMEVQAYAVMGFAFAGLLLSMLPVYLRTVSRWWYAVPVVLGLAAWLRTAAPG
ncbi:hypothetical protein ACIQV2_31900 [Streptomyces globosus]|jgi:hypothetical protein|uniref:hypothetical protein n=1 Tax=Streptomyces TaxID=1883 RepID=UPI000F7442EB|nr:hypothetical protein [Streptomyces sp. WAC05292]RSS84728.1 hypothetical protein EF903_23315 [Streptomyces sp. WAC05292]